MAEHLSPLSQYVQIAPLCQKGHVVLVKNKADGMLYVMKRLGKCSVDVFQQLRTHRVENTPAIRELWQDETGVTVIEDYICGSTIAERIEQEGFFSEKETLDIALQLCRIVSDLHALRPAIIHRDIKPSNIILTSNGKVKLLDFNAAKLMTTETGQDTVLLGTAGYAAPEQYGFSVSSCQTDIYAIGVLMNVCLNGKLPVQQTAGGMLQRAIRRCTALDPQDRYPSTKELARALVKAGKTKYRWLPPGFRTMRPFKMVLAILGYLLFAAFLMDLGPTSDDTSNIWIIRLSLAFSGIAQLVFCTNYLGLRRYFPFMRCKQRFFRIIGAIISPFITFIAGILLGILVEQLFL